MKKQQLTAGFLKTRLVETSTQEKKQDYDSSKSGGVFVPRSLVLVFHHLTV